MGDLTKLFKYIDESAAVAMKREGKQSPCCKGCFACCKEPAYVTRSEVLHLLSGLSAKELARVKQLTSSWIRAFWKSGMKDVVEPSVYAYRVLNLYCPLLKDGECSVYDRRPSCCRLHIALEDKQRCEVDELRKTQVFAHIPELCELVFNHSFQSLESGENECYDHLGVLLYEHFFGIEAASVARVKATARNNDLTIEKYEDDDHEPARS